MEQAPPAAAALEESSADAPSVPQKPVLVLRHLRGFLIGTLGGPLLPFTLPIVIRPPNVSEHNGVTATGQIQPSCNCSLEGTWDLLLTMFYGNLLRPDSQ